MTLTGKISQGKNKKLCNKIRGTALYFLRSLLLIAFITVFYTGYSQNDESAVISRAEAFFVEENYQEALPLYAQLVSVHPQNPEYNYKFGVCTLFGDRSDRRRPIRYLTNALRGIGDEPMLNYYLGLAYYQNEEFANAIKFLNQYLGTLDPTNEQRPVILEMVNASVNGMNLDHDKLIDEIISKSEFQKNNFHRAYRADDFTGMLILKPEIFVTANENNSTQNSFVYIDEPRGTLYFSGYEKGTNKDRDIFRVEMTENGDWGKPEVVGDMINTHFDEAYPIVTDYGTTLYFCSKGHNSMGGYDIFKSKIDTATNTFSKPENLGVGINSPFDDVLYIPDKSGRCAYFASDRDNLNEAITVYKVRLMDQNQGNMMLASGSEQQSIPDNSNASVNNTSNSHKEEDVAVVEKQPTVDPAQKAKNLVNERVLMHKYADTAYLFVAQTRQVVKELTNKRDRANAISSRKKEEAKELEIEFENLMNVLAETKELADFESKLLKAVKLKTEIYKNREAADMANQIAWNIGKHIKVKNQEVEQLKVKAGEVQTLSVQGNFEKTSLAFGQMKEEFIVADSLTDFSGVVVKIARGDVEVEVPNSEIAFADKLRQAFETETLYAEIKNSVHQNKEDIPINIVDHRTNSTNEQRPVIVALQVEEIPFVAIATEEINEPSLEISFLIDAVKPYKQIHEILIKDLLTVNEQEIDEELEINFYVDGTKPLDIVEPVFASIGWDEIPEEALGIDFTIDGIDALPLVEPVDLLLAEMRVEDEELEIDFTMDGVEPFAVIHPIAFASSNHEIEINDVIAIDFSIDGIKALPLVENIKFAEEIAFFEEEHLEMNFSMDGVEPHSLIQPIAFANADTEIEINEALAIDFDVDGIDALPLVEPILATVENIFETENEILELSFEIDGVNAIPQVEMVAFANVEPEIEDQLEMNFDIDKPSFAVLPLTEQIAFSATWNIDLEEEELEINADQETIKMLALVEPVEIAFASVEFFMMEDEELEISTESVELIQLVETIAFVNSEENLIPDEELEINIELTSETPAALASVSANNEIIKAENMVKVVQPVYYSAIENDLFLTDENEIEVIFFESETDQAISTSGSPENSSIPAIGSELFYLRESLSIASRIETDYTDVEMLKRALTDPVDLSYEELLYSASLASSHDDKMSIFNQAFVHINRDWRAFNNAAVSAMNINDLDQAEVLLYQASLISERNGDILNNQGILACYQNQFETAKERFIAAAECGTNSDYNLAFVNSMITTEDGNANELQRKIGDHKYYEVLSDMIEQETNE